MPALMSDADIGLAPSAPLGIRNNNPGNLRPPGASTGFQQFASMDEGVAAADHQLDLYGQRGLTTISDVISKWAPSNENNTRAYIKAVSDKLGLPADEPLNLSDPKTRRMLRDAMLDHETPGWKKAAAPAAGAGLSDSDIGLPKDAEPGGLGHMLKRGAKDLAGLADMVLSTPGGLLSTMVGKGYETFAPLPTSKEQAAEQLKTGADLRAVMQAHTTSPIAHIMHAMGYPNDYSDSDVGKVTNKLNEWMGKGGDWIAQHSGGVINQQQVRVLSQDMMNIAPLGFSRFALAQRGKLSPEELRTGKLKNGTANDILGRYTEEMGNPTGETPASIKTKMEQTLSGKSDAEINAEAKAYDLMKRGASLREVQAARKANPLVGQKLDEFMSRRTDTMGGPLSTHIPIDEILGPRPPEGAGGLPGLENRPTTGSAGPDVSTPQPDTGTPPSPGNAPANRLLTGPVARLTNQHPGRFPGRGQSGAVDTRMLIPLAGAAAGAYFGAAASDREKLEGAILGGFGGLAATVLPRYAGQIGQRWGTALKLGATTAGLSYGLSRLDKDHPVEGAVLGMLWGVSRMAPKARIPQVGDMTIDELVNARNGAIAAAGRQTSNTSWAMRTAVPDPVRRAAIAEAVEKGSPAGLNGAETKVYNAYRGFTASYGQAAKDTGVLKDLLTNYVTHAVEREGLPQTKVQEVLDALFGGADATVGGARTSSGFAKTRKYATFQELEKALAGSGLRIRTRDIADLVDIYGSSMAKAIENKKLFDNLKAAREPGGRAFIEPAEHAPGNYQTVNTPQLQGMRVHPDLAPAVKFVAEQYKPGYVTKGLLSLSLAQKRLATGLSLFHAQNLINAYIGASGLRSARLKGDVDAALKLYRQGGLGDVVDLGLRNGLKIERPMETDLGAGAKLGAAIDGLVNQTLGTKWSAFEKGIGGVEKVQRETFDKLTWDYLHSGLKLALFVREFEKGLRAHPDWPKEKVAAQVASFANDTFGGLDWYRVATETQSQLGRNLALSTFSPRGRSALQILMFAPDWTMSTFRAMYKALPGSTAMPLTTRLHQKYVLRTALMWATLMNGYNMMASGHPIWQNQDPTKIEWRDGTTQQIAKHAMEGPEWLLNPRQTAVNKLGMIPSEVMDQLQGVDYMRADGKSPPMTGSRIGHAAQHLAPLSFQTGSVPGRSLEESAKRTALSTLGMPVYRMSKAEKAAAKRAREQEKRKGSKTYGTNK